MAQGQNMQRCDDFLYADTQDQVYVRVRFFLGGGLWSDRGSGMVVVHSLIRPGGA